MFGRTISHYAVLEQIGAGVPNVQANFSATGVTFVNDTSAAIAVYTQDGNIAGTASGRNEAVSCF